MGCVNSTQNVRQAREYQLDVPHESSAQISSARVASSNSSPSLAALTRAPSRTSRRVAASGFRYPRGTGQDEPPPTFNADDASLGMAMSPTISGLKEDPPGLGFARAVSNRHSLLMAPRHSLEPLRLPGQTIATSTSSVAGPVPDVLQLHWYGNPISEKNILDLFSFKQCNPDFKVSIYTDNSRLITDVVKKVIEKRSGYIEHDPQDILKSKNITIKRIQDVWYSCESHADARLRKSIKNFIALQQSDGHGSLSNQAARSDEAKLFTLAEDGGGWSIHWEFLTKLRTTPLPSIRQGGLFPLMIPLSHSSATIVSTVLACGENNKKARAAWERMLQKNMDHIVSQPENLSKTGHTIFISDNERRPFQFSSLHDVDAHLGEHKSGWVRRDRTMENTRIFPRAEFFDGVIQPSDIMKNEYCNASLLNSKLQWALARQKDIRSTAIYNAHGVADNIDEIDISAR